MIKTQKIATIFGGTGFVGRHVVRRLARAGYTVKVATRTAEQAYFLKPCGTPGQIVPIAYDSRNPRSIATAVAGAQTVINATGILYEKKRKDFIRVHTDLPRMIAESCRDAGVSDFIHISALGVDRGKSRYAASKRAGEQAARAAFPATAILRPSVIFGPEDDFFNKFAELARYLPTLPLIGGGKTRFQPVYVGDVGDAVMACIGNAGAAGKTFELGGPETVTFREIYERLFRITGRRRALVSLPFGAAKFQAFFMQMLPHPLLTRDQVESLKTDSIVTPGALTLVTLGIAPRPMDGILRDYLEYARPGGHFADKKRA